MRCIALLWIIAASAWAPARGGAQAVPRPAGATAFAGAEPALAIAPGTRVRVWTSDPGYPPMRRAGRLITIGPDSLTFAWELARRPVVLPLDSVLRLEFSRERHPQERAARRGAAAIAVGAAGGFVGFLWGLSQTAICEGHRRGPGPCGQWGVAYLIGAVGVGAAGGAAAGAVLAEVAMPSETWEAARLPAGPRRNER